jgi:hypothetical protein
MTAVLRPAVGADQVESIIRALEADGAVALPRLVSDETLLDMQRAFASRLQGLRWNDCDGYERTEVSRFMVPDVLTLAQGFVDVGLHPLVKAVLNRYLGEGRYELCEAKGWRSLPTKKDLHGWHGDAWYDQTKITDHVPREVKVAFYLTDVKSGAFAYLAGSHRQQVPHLLSRSEREAIDQGRVIEFLGPAGTAVLFDTSGIHRQSVPMLEPRQAIFLNYHDPDVPLQQEDVEYYRYHPLLLNAAFLGGLSDEDGKILGFGNKTNYQPGYARRSANTWQRGLAAGLLAARVYLNRWCEPVVRRLFRAKAQSDAQQAMGANRMG